MNKLQFKKFKAIVSFTLKESIESSILNEKIVKVFSQHEINICDTVGEQFSKLLTAPSNENTFTIECIGENENFELLEYQLQKYCDSFVVRPQYFISNNNKLTKWFPFTKHQLYKYCNYVIGQSDVEHEHVGFLDTLYCARRKLIVQKSLNHTPNKPLPHIDYTISETETWSKIFGKLSALYKSYACEEYNKYFKYFVDCGIFNTKKIPQLEQLSKFLEAQTGFTLYPVAGFLAPRDFLAALAFRVFRSTQYIRHASEAWFTGEPDVCHEILGHTPMFANEEFAEFSQAIGLASLGASDEFIEKLAACYWFSIEFGLCRQKGQLKAYGAGLLSSYGELDYCFNENKSEFRPFDPYNACDQGYKLSGYQPVYYVAESFADATGKVREYASSIPRGFSANFNKTTEEIDILN